MTLAYHLIPNSSKDSLLQPMVNLRPKMTPINYFNMLSLFKLMQVSIAQWWH